MKSRGQACGGRGAHRLGFGGGAPRPTLCPIAFGGLSFSLDF